MFKLKWTDDDAITKEVSPTPPTKTGQLYVFIACAGTTLNLGDSILENLRQVDMISSKEHGFTFCPSSPLPPVSSLASFEQILPAKQQDGIIESCKNSCNGSSSSFLDQGKHVEVWKRKRGHSISSPIAVARALSISSSSSSSYSPNDKRRKTSDIGNGCGEKTSSTSPLSSSSFPSSSSISTSLPIPSSSIVSKCFGVSRRGFAPQLTPAKKNQDAYLIFQNEASNSMIFCCMDGHGQQGELCSAYFRNRIEEELTSHPSFISNIRTAIEETVSKIEKDMVEDTNIDTEMSGSTLIIAVVRNTKLIVANVGDSRVICGYRDASTGEICVERISVDHKPEVESEANRIISRGGRIAAIKYPEGEIGPLRVFLQDAPTPGLAMSRSVGDVIAHKVGVISEPEFFERELIVPDDILLIVATDGLW